MLDTETGPDMNTQASEVLVLREKQFGNHVKGQQIDYPDRTPKERYVCILWDAGKSTTDEQGREFINQMRRALTWQRRQLREYRITT